jgi:uncharacterized protein
VAAVAALLITRPAGRAAPGHGHRCVDSHRPARHGYDAIMTHTRTTATTALGAQRFASLTTFRQDGSPVATPVWVTQDGDVLVVTTPAESHKVRRLRRDPRVLLVPCGRTGHVAAGARPVRGTAQIVTDPAESARMTRLVRRKYGLQYRLVMLVERIVARRHRPRVLLRITLSE